nr:PKS7818 [Inonotus obliquus]
MVMRVILFDGQGSHPSSSSSVVQHPQSPLATLFVHQARAAFAARIASLASATRDALNDRATRILLGKISDGSIVIPSSDASLLRHPLIALPSLYVTQVVRLLEEVETNGPVAKGASVEVIGYSSGILPALLVATSFPSPKVANSNLSPSSQLTILRHALAIFAVAMSIGIEAQVSKEAMLTECGIALDDPSREREWSAVVLGEKRDALETRLTSWNSQRKDHLRVHLTAETAASCHTISGLPSALGEFLNSSIIPFGSRYTSASQISLLSSSSSTSDGSIRSDDNVISRRTPATSGSAASVIPLCPSLSQTPDNSSLLEHNPPFTSGVTRNATNLSQVPSTSKTLGIYTLFHANTPHLRAARDRDNGSDEAVEISTTLSTLRVVDGFALHDVRTGSTVLTSMIGRKLVELVVDSILLDRIEFSNTVETLAKRATQCPHIEIINVGPGTGLARAAMRNLRVLFRGDTTLSDLSSSAKTMTSAKETPVSIDRRSQEPIAIVGMAVNFPGARDASELWRVLEQGLNTVEEIPETRFSISPYAEANASPGRQLKTRYGNFLPDGLHASFDNTFFRISPREARAMDPQMRVLMRTGLQAMEAAGLVVQEFAADGQNLGEGILRSEDVGCFVGVATNDYAHNLRNDVGVHYATGTLPAFLAGRLAYALHLSGPSIVLDTACSSSLVAIHQACRALLAGDCKAALAGGVNIVTSPDMYLGLDRAHFLSPTGNCKPWDASANGYCRAEGSGMFVLKRLSDALGCSDNILGVIRGTEVNQSAAAVSITRPHGPTQAALFRTLLDKADVRAEEISVVEAHGTGTQAGDPEELKSLRDVLSPNHGAARNPTNVLTVTSVKGNIGHAEAASGAASLAKVLLMLRHRAIPTQVGLDSLNPKIESLEKDFTRINTSGASVEWSSGATGRRIALVNNFGAAGSNAAMLVEEAPSRNPIPFDHACAKGSDDHVIVGLSAESEDALIRLRDSYMMSITSIPDSSLVDFGYTTTARRRLRPWRIAVSADSATGLVRALSNARPNCVSGSPILGKKTVFVFSGQGGQYVGMSRQLYSLSSSFRAIIDDCNEKLVNWGYPGILPIINGCDLSLLKNEELVAFQCAMFVLQCALCSMWESWGIKPDAVIGHSLGEYAALVVSGVLTRDAGLRLVAHRALLMTQRCEQNVSGMVAVRLPARYVSDMIAKLGGCDGLSVACHNGQHDVVVGGPRAQLEVLKAHLDLSGVKCATVDVPFAYHTAAMEPILEDMAVFARKFNFSAPVIPISSNVTGNVVSPGDGSVFCGEYLARHCRQVVRFEEGARALVGEIGSASAFVEIGPHPTTVPSIAHLASASGSVTLHTLHKRMTDRTALCSALSRLFVFRSDVAWGRVYRDLYPLAKCIEIPGYPLQETEFWIPFVEEVTGVPVSATPAIDPLEKFFFLSSWTHKPSTNDANISEFETPITHLAEYITGHHVASSPLCPASVYYELALSAATCTLKYAEENFADALTLSDIQFTVPLVYDPANLVTVRTCINLHPKGGKHTGTFYISSVSGEKEQVVHCTGFFQRRNKGMTASKLATALWSHRAQQVRHSRS